MAREFAKAFYNSSAWKQAREMAMMRDHMTCVKCDELAEEVHHKIKLTPSNINDPRISLSLDNLICLCHDCHMKEHAGISESPYEFDANGQLVKKR